MPLCDANATRQTKQRNIQVLEIIFRRKHRTAAEYLEHPQNATLSDLTPPVRTLSAHITFRAIIVRLWSVLLMLLPWAVLCVPAPRSRTGAAIALWQPGSAHYPPPAQSWIVLGSWIQGTTKVHTLHAAELCVRGDTTVAQHIAPVNEHMGKRSLCCRGAEHTLIVNFVKMSEHLVQRPAHESSSSSRSSGWRDDCSEDPAYLSRPFGSHQV